MCRCHPQSSNVTTYMDSVTSTAEDSTCTSSGSSPLHVPSIITAPPGVRNNAPYHPTVHFCPDCCSSSSPSPSVTPHGGQIITEQALIHNAAGDISTSSMSSPSLPPAPPPPLSAGPHAYASTVLEHCSCGLTFSVRDNYAAAQALPDSEEEYFYPIIEQQQHQNHTLPSSLNALSLSEYQSAQSAHPLLAQRHHTMPLPSTNNTHHSEFYDHGHSHSHTHSHSQQQYQSSAHAQTNFSYAQR